MIASYYEYRRYETGQVPFWTPLRFPGQYFDAESDLFENWNRIYDGTKGAYLQREPLVDVQPKGQNALYGYAGNSPLVSTDSTGMYRVVGWCPNYATAIQIAKQKAGCYETCPKCKLPCNICKILDDESSPELRPTDLPGTCPESSGCKGATWCPIGEDPKYCFSQVLRRYCTDPSAVDLLAQALFHEALHYCGANDPGDASVARFFWLIGSEDDAPVWWDAKGITDACWK